MPRRPFRAFTCLLLSITAFLITLQTRTLSVGTASWHIANESIAQPESIYYSAEKNIVFVANVVNGDLDKDGQGWISKVSPDGQLMEAKWVEGLNAPHGIRSHAGKLWVADIDALVAIDMETGAITSRTAIPGALFLNDVAVAEDGRVFVSDTLLNKIFVVKDGQVDTFADSVDLDGPNGLLIHGDDLIVATWGKVKDPVTFETEAPGSLFKINLNTQIKEPITEKVRGNLDGIEINNAGNLLVSDYTLGKVFLVNPDNGNAHVLVTGLAGIADIGFIPERNLLLVPNMAESTLTAYQLPGQRYQELGAAIGQVAPENRR